MRNQFSPFTCTYTSWLKNIVTSWHANDIQFVVLYLSLDSKGPVTLMRDLMFHLNKLLNKPVAWPLDVKLISGAREPHRWEDSIVSGNGLVPSGNKASHETIFTQNFVNIQRH